MCPVCVASTALLIAKATSGGVTALAARNFFKGRKLRRGKEQKYEHSSSNEESRSGVRS